MIRSQGFPRYRKITLIENNYAHYRILLACFNITIIIKNF